MNRSFKPRLSIAVALLSLCGSLVFAAGPADQKAANVDDVMTLSGVNTQLTQFSELFAAPLTAGSAAMPDQFRQVVDILIENVTDDLIRQETKTALTASYQEAHYKNLTAFFGTDLGKRIVKAEIAASGLNSFEDSSGFDYDKIPDSRKKIFEAAFKDSNFTDLQFAVAKAALMSFFDSLNLLIPEENKLGPEMIEGTVQQLHDTMYSDEAKIDYLKHLGMTYQDFSDAELSSYFKVVSSPAGKWLSAGIAAGIDSSMRKATAVAHEKIVQQVSPLQIPENQ